MLPLVAAVLVAMEIVALSGAVPAPHLALSAHRISPFMAGVLAIAFLVHLAARPRRGEIAATLALAAALGLASKPRPALPILVGYSLGLASLLALGARSIFTRGPARDEARQTFSAAAVFPAFFMSMITGLALTVVIHPATYDGTLYHLDAALGAQPSFAVGSWFSASPALAWTCEAVYRGIPLAAGVLLARPIAASRSRMIETFVASGILGFSLYHLVPAAGPGYAFRGQFPALLPALADVSIAPSVIPPFDRNCVPSLHTTWALFLLWFSRGRGPLVRAGAAFWLACTLLATLGLGEHYAVDLVIAVPFAAGVHALSARALPISAPERAAPIAAGALLVALWISVIRLGPSVLAAHDPLMGLLVILSVVLPLVLHRRLVLALDGAAALPEAPRVVLPAGLPASAVALSLLGAAASLDLAIAYRSAQLFIGFAASTWILAAGAATAALGALAGSRIDARGGTPFRWLAHSALGIGILGAALPRVAWLPLCFLAALPLPAVAARMTPALAGGAAALGGALGAFASVYLILPYLGMQISTLPALVLGLTVALFGLRLARGSGPLAFFARALKTGPLADARGSEIALLFTSAAAPAIVMVFSERLAAAVGDSAHTSALVLSTSLIGLAVGAFLACHLAPTQRLLGALAFALLVTVMVCWPSVPALDRRFAALADYKAVRDFAGHHLVRFFVIAAAIVPPAALAGAIVTACLPRARSRSLAAALFAASLGLLATGALRAPRAVDPGEFQSVHAASRVTREALAKAEGEAVTLIVPLDRLFEDDVLAILATAHTELPSISVYVSGARATIVACRSECAPHAPERADFILSPADTRKLLADRARVTAGSLVMTNDDLRLAWSAPRAAVVPREELLRANLRLLRSARESAR